MQTRFANFAGLRLAVGAVLVLCVSLSCESPVAPEPNTPIGLRVWASVAPTTLPIHDSTATVRIRIYVQNPAAESLRVTSGGPPYIFTLNPSHSQGLEESFHIASGTDSLNAGPNTDYWGQPVYVFGPHETRYTEAIVTLRQWRAGGWPLVPETLRVRSYFNGREGESASFRLVP